MATKKKKKLDPIKQREKRAKIIALVGGVLLLGVAAIEVPSVMKQMKAKPPPVAATAPATSTPNPGGLALPQVGATAAGATSSSGLADTDVPPPASSVGQLVTFNAFEMKNPFKPQVSSAPAVDPNPPDPSTPAAAAAAAPAPATTPSQPVSAGESLLTPPGSVPPATTTATTTTTPTTMTTTPAPATVSTVAISVNGSVSRVGTAGTFPTAAPVFRLVSWRHGSAQIAIVGGSYATGGQTLTLRLQHPVTLQNTNNGKQYKLILVSTP
jgi:hypothetical protein